MATLPGGARSIRRFYREAASVADDRADTPPAEDRFAGRPCWRLVLDGRPGRTPAGAPFRLPHRRLAAAIAQEWQAQEERIDPATMPMTRLAATALDRIGRHRGEIIRDIANYAGTDLLCYRAETPADLVRLQQQAWQPLLDWADEHLGAHLVVTAGVVPVAQPPEAVARLAARVAAADDFTLTALAATVQATGSLIIGLALVDGRLAADAAFDAALLDERYQAAQWGVDPEAEARRRRLADEIGEASRFLGLLADDGGPAGPSGEDR
jgi:chaperone required for assembly of F1-ATPase